MDDELNLPDLLIAVAMLLVGILGLLVLTAAVGWLLSAITPLTLAQGVFVSLGTIVVAVLSLSPHRNASLLWLLIFSVAISLVTSATILLLAWPVDLLTSLTRWEATLQAFAAVNVLAYVFIRQAVADFDPVVRVTSMRAARHHDWVDHDILNPPAAAKPRRRRRKAGNRPGGDEGSP